MALVMKAVSPHSASVAVLALALMAAAHADEIRSPFLPPNVSGSSGAVDPNAMQLRGIMSTSTGVKYNIYDPGKKSSVWVGVNEAGNGFLIKSADVQKDAVTMSANGQVITLELQKGHVQTPAANGVPQGGAVLKPTPADEQLRLQAVADEVRRRRLLREQAAGQPGVPGQPGAPGAVSPDGTTPPAVQPGTNRQRRRD